MGSDPSSYLPDVIGLLDCIPSIKTEMYYIGGFLPLMPPVVPLGMQDNIVTP